MSYFSNLDKAMENLVRGAFFTTTDGETVNTMTITWGFIGYSFGKPYFMAMIRPSRYTFEILEKADSFTVSIPFTSNFNEALRICGAVSGRDVDKTVEANISFMNSKTVNSPVVRDCDQYYECVISHKIETAENHFGEAITKSFYGSGDYHHLVYGEIKEAYGS